MTSTSPGSPAASSIRAPAAAATTPTGARVPDCVTITPGNVGDSAWLPQSCAYRRVAEGRGLEWWHPLVSGDPETVHQAGVSVRGWSRSEKGVSPSAIARFIIGAPD